MGGIELNLDIYKNVQMMWQRTVDISASKSFIRRFVITEKALVGVESGYYRFHI